MSKQKFSAFQLGRFAFEDDQPSSTNPYALGSKKRKAFAKGYSYAKKRAA